MNDQALANLERVDRMLDEIACTHDELSRRGFMLPRRCAILYEMGRAGLTLDYYSRVSELYARREARRSAE